MRQITRDAADAFRAGVPFSRSNTTVTVDDEGNVTMTLFGNKIVRGSTDSDGVLISNAGWHSNTTVERLRAFADVYRRQGTMHLQGERMEDRTWYYISGGNQS